MSVQNDCNQQRQASIRQVTWLGGAIDATLGTLKITVGWISHSPALIADGFHSLSDLLTDFGVVFFSRLAQGAPDEDHPYGHHRYETLGTVILGTSLVVVASAIAWDNILSIIYGTHAPQASLLAVLIAIISIVGKEWVFRFTLKAAKRFQSKLLEANAWHSRSDALSSIVVLFGVIATWIGYGWLELVAAIIVALMIGKMGVMLTWNASQDLIDRGIAPQLVHDIEQTIRNTEGVVDVHMLRSRMMGNYAYLDVHIQVDGMVSVSEGHFISDQVVLAVKQAHDSVSDITVHVDCEKDLGELQNLIEELPNRQQIIQQLRDKGIFPARLQIHYLSQKIKLELFFEETPEDVQQIRLTLKQWLVDKLWLHTYAVHISVNVS